MPNVDDHRSVTAAWTNMINHIYKDKYTGLIADSINFHNFTFSHFADTRYRSALEIWRFLIALGHLTLTAELKYVIFHKLREKQSGIIPDSINSKIFFFCGTDSLLKIILYILSRRVQ